MKKLLQNEWVITIVATMLGIIMGIYLTNYFNEKREQKKAAVAFDSVILEIQENMEMLKEWDTIVTREMPPFEIICEHLIEGSQDVAFTVAEMQDFKASYPDYLEIQDSQKLNQTQYRYDITFDVDLNSSLALIPQHDLSWEAFKSTNFLSHLSFDCIRRVEAFYQLFNRSNQHRITWVNNLSKQAIEQKEKRELLFYDFAFETRINQSLFQLYEVSQASFEDCKPL